MTNGQPESLSQLAARYYPRIRRMARQLARRLPSSIDSEDLVQAAMLALVSAARAFDPARGQSLDAYLAHRLRGSMLDELRALDPLSRDERRDVRAIDAACRELGGELGRSPTTAEVSARTGLEQGRLHTLEERRQAVHGAALDDALMPAAQTPDVTDEIAQRRAAKAVEGAVTELNPRQQQIIALRYRDELSLREIGQLLSVTESRVCQLHAEAVTQLRRIVLDTPRAAVRRAA